MNILKPKADERGAVASAWNNKSALQSCGRVAECQYCRVETGHSAGLGLTPSVIERSDYC